MRHRQSDKLRVLIADDDENIRRAMVRILQPKFDIVGTAGCGRELLESARSLLPDVVVSDLNMPVMSGLEVMGLLRQAGLRPAFVLVSAGTEAAIECINRGALAVVDKLDMHVELASAVTWASCGFSYMSAHARRSP